MAAAVLSTVFLGSVAALSEKTARHPRKEVIVRHHPMYGRTLTLDDWPMLSDVIQRSRDMQLGTRMACLIQGEEDIRAKELAFWELGGDVFHLTFKTKRPDALYFPNSLLADGRNYLYAAATMWELQMGQRYLYYIHSDADAFAEDWSMSWRAFQSFLFDWQPAVGLPALFDYEQILEDYKYEDDESVRSVMNFDHQVEAIHSDAAVWLLPYDTKLDNDCQWVSQWRFSSLANALFPEHTLLTHTVSVKNPHHASYSKSRCLDLMQNVTEELRNAEAAEFRSCFVNPSNQALVVDGLPRLTAYLPWFSPAKRRPNQNYSQRPQLRSCEDQAVVKAWRASESEGSGGAEFSWCRGCPISVSFALLQTIVVTRPFDFSGWVKLANILAMAAARRQDLMAAHVAFTVASRLIWCSEGLSGSLMDAEELKGFYEGHEQHGIVFDKTSETLEDVQKYILELGEGVIYNGIRAALSPFEERVNRAQPPMISEENVELLVKLVTGCDDPENHLVLMKQG